MKMSTLVDVESCYRYILGRDMNPPEADFARAEQLSFANMPVGKLRRQFLQSAEFHQLHLETLFENLIPKSVTVCYETPMGFTIYLDLRQLHLSFGILNGGYEQREIAILRQIVADDATFFDVGGNVGYFSLSVASRPGFAGRVVAFEPLAPLHALFVRSVAANRLEQTITPRQLALGAARSVMSLTDAEHSINAGSTRLVTTGTASASARTVEVETLDRVAVGVAPDVIKVDIEGAEWLFFQGGAQTFETSAPTVLFEVNPELLAIVSRAEPSKLQQWLLERDYRLWLVEADGLRAISKLENLNDVIPATGVGNVLAVHPRRMAAVSARLPDLA